MLDEAAVLSCMTYVDLNPVRAGMQQDLVDSDFTSIQQRLYDYVKHKPVRSATEKSLTNNIAHQRKIRSELKLGKLPEAPLMPLDDSTRTEGQTVLPFSREDYFELVDTTVRIIREDKRGFISEDVPRILKKLGVKPDRWLDQVKYFSRRYGACADCVARMESYCESTGRRWSKGMAMAKRLAFF